MLVWETGMGEVSVANYKNSTLPVDAWVPPHLVHPPLLSATSQLLMEAPPHPCHPERTPNFLLRCANQRPRMRLSVRKAAWSLSTPRSFTGNPEEAEGPAVRLSLTQLPGAPHLAKKRVRNGAPTLCEGTIGGLPRDRVR